MQIRPVRTLLCLWVASCAPAAPAPRASTAAVAPVIERIEPARGPAGVAYPIRITLQGRHFADSANVVQFGPVTITDVPATAGGTRIVFYAPKEAATRSEAAPPPLAPGSYAVTVTTGAGTSNAVPFTLTPESGDRQ